MRTIIIQIGNTDDKLSQVEWSTFYWAVQSAVLGAVMAGGKIHFSAASPGFEPWQNACWVFEVLPVVADSLRAEIVEIRGKFRQDSVAWTEGETAFV